MLLLINYNILLSSKSLHDECLSTEPVGVCKAWLVATFRTAHYHIA